MKVLVLGGDISPEREVSLRSSASIKRALETAGYDVYFYDPADGDQGLDSVVQQVDVVLPILHGVGGEDGVIQRKLESLGAPFLGSGSKVSEVTFDKVLTHKKLESCEVLMPLYTVVNQNSFQSEKLAQEPFVLKPIRGGSSVDTYIVRSIQNLDMNAVNNLLSKYETMILEELIIGQEITVPVLDDKPLPVIAIIPPENGEFDYENKYNGKSQEICPVPIETVPEELQHAAQELACKVHELLGVRHLSRTDIMIDSKGDMYVLEINTMPGMTDQSLFPKSALASGLSMEELVTMFVSMAKEG